MTYNVFNLSSGFTTTNQAGLVASDKMDIVDITDAVRIGADIDLKLNSFYRQDICDLYEAYMNDHKLADDMDFIDKLLSVMISVFKPYSVLDWFLLQDSGKRVTSVHRRFLVDTLDYLYAGRSMVGIANYALEWDDRVATEADKNISIKAHVGKLKDAELIWNRVDAPTSSAVDLNMFTNQWVNSKYGVANTLIWFHYVFGKHATTKE